MTETKTSCEVCGDKTYRELLDDNARVRSERDEHKTKREEYASEARSLRVRLKETQEQRDEASRELDFIKAEYGGEDDELLTMDALIVKLRLALAGAEDSIAAHVEHERQLRVESSELAQEAFQRGAEMMREAAASIFDAPLSTPGREELLAWANAIRALPIPEDKP